MVTKLLQAAYVIMGLVRPWSALATFLISMLAVVTARPVMAQAPWYEGKEVVTIQFVPEEGQPLEPAERFALLRLKVRQPLRLADVRASIERLFATGRYKDIKVDVSPYNNGVIVRFLTQNSWFIGGVAVEGKISDPPNPGQLQNAARLYLGQPFVEDRLQQAVAGQRSLLQSNGLYNSRIQPSFEYDSTYQQVHIRFDVVSGKRARYGPPVFQGDFKLAPERLLTASRFRRWIIHTWKPVSQSRTRQGMDGILRLYQKEDRLEAKVKLDTIDYDAATNRAIPKLTIQGGPKLQINTIGAKLARRKLQRLVPVFEEHTVDNDLLVEGAHNLRSYFQAEGYFAAEVEFKQQRVVNDKANIDYLINTGARHRMVYIAIDGNRYFDLQAIRERMFLEPASLLQFRHGRYSEDLLRRDEDTIGNLYRSNGFRDAVITHRVEDDYRSKAGDVAVLIHIEEGPQSFVASLRVDGIEKLNQQEILGTLSSTEGQPFSEFNVAVDRDTILARYFAGGYPNATFEWSSKPAAKPNQVDLHFVIREGEEQVVRQVLISGLKTTRLGLVNRNLRLNPGDPLSPIAMTDTQRRLYDLGVFARVETAIQNPDGATPSKYVLYELDEARRYSLAAGFGAEFARIGGCQNCFDSPAGQTGFSPRISLDLTRSNLWGLAHSVSLRGRISNLEERALINYSAPRFRNDERLNLSFTGLYDLSRDVRTFSAKRQEGSVQLSQRYSKATTFFYRYTYRRVSVDDSTLKITPFLIPLYSQPVRVGILSVNMVQDRRDDPVDPRKGIYNTVDLGLAEHIFGSQRNFLRFLVRNATYHPLTRKLVLARSTQLGNIYSFRYGGNALDAIPLAERFFGGGGTSQRGFPENQAGPRDTVTGFPLGGTALFFNQTEVRFPLLGDNVGGVLFHDMGNVYSSLSAISARFSQKSLQDFDYLEHAVGFGIRYRTPVGPIRLDLAYSIKPPSFIGYNGTQQDLLTAGTQPCAVPGRCTQQNVSHFQFFFSIGQTF